MKYYQVYDAYRMGDVFWLPSDWLAAAVICFHMPAGA